MLDPLVLVIPRKETAGLSSLSSEKRVELFPYVPIRTALETAQDTDAHHGLSFLPGQTEGPRLNKSAEADLIAQGQPVLLGVIGLDWDTPGHRRLEPSEGVSLITKIKEKKLPDPSAWWETEHGVRLLYFLTTPLPPHEAEGLILSMLDLFERSGISLDKTCKDWTRQFRLPKVVRNGKMLNATVHYGPDLDPCSIQRTKVVKPLCVRTLNLPQPSEVVRDLVIVPKGKGSALTEWAKDAKKTLGERMDGALKALFETNPPGIPEPRNDTLMRWMGCAAAVLSHLDGTTPEHLYGLFLGAAHNAVKPSDAERGRDLTAELWKITCYCWAREQAKREAEQEERGTARDRLIRNMHLHSLTQATVNESNLDQHMLLLTDSGAFVLRMDGSYGDKPVKRRDEIVVEMRNLEQAGVLSLSAEGKSGPKMLKPDAILARFGTRKSGEVITKAGKPGTAYFDGENIVRSGFGLRTDLDPKKWNECADWLWALADENEAKHNPLCHGWIARSLNFDGGPICALSIVAPPGVGKQLFTRGLAGTINTGVFANGEIFCDWQYRMDKTPFIVVNEAFPAKAREPDVKIRQLIGGDDVDMKTKYNHPEGICTNPRIVFTANNPGLYQQLLAGCKNEDDRRAVSRRVLHFQFGDGGAKWLNKHGNRKTTNAWIQDHKLAQHFLWLYHEYGQEIGDGRFLMEGPSEPDFVSSVQANSRLTALCETLWRMAETGNNLKFTERGWLATKASLVKSAASAGGGEYPRRDELGSEAWIGRALRQLRSSDERLSIDNVHDLYEIDIVKLIAFAEANDLPCPKMKAMAAKKEEVACGLSTHSGS
jgi:hypothetical protein